MDVIKIKNIEDIKTAYKKAGVSEKRIEALGSKFQILPDQFKIHGLCFPKVTLGKKVVTVPSFALDAKGVKTVPVGQLFASYTDTHKASQIQKVGDYTHKWLVVNNRRVNSFAEGLSEEEFIAHVNGKEFKAEPAKDYPVYSGFVEENGENILRFHDTAEDAVKAIQPKSYRAVSFVIKTS